MWKHAAISAAVVCAAILLQGCGDDAAGPPTESVTTSTAATTLTTTTATTSTTSTSGTTYTSQRVGSFMVIGDWGWDERVHGDIKSRACQQAVADAMGQRARLLGDLKFVINVGDSFYPDGVANKSDPQWDVKWRNVYPPEVRAVPWYSVYGNHDYNHDPCACADDYLECAQVNANASDLDFFFMPELSYFVDRADLNLEVIALDMNYHAWANYTCPYSPCEEKCRANLRRRTEEAFDLFYNRTAVSTAENLVVFSHYPTDYFLDHPDFLEELSNNATHRIQYFGGHRHNVDQRSTTSIWPNTAWLSGGGGGWGCEAWYGDEQGFVVGEIAGDGTVTTYPVIIDFEVCCERPVNITAAE